ncbi:MAG TPA: winged helix-turn-helix domain-containing protein [Vicinamibacterales bacterium]|jgi:DNA-binding Lrp family transcriptional regulator|nr:winged helix-turn-helix domain-containing protein [Vicinamibacterales bacterium]
MTPTRFEIEALVMRIQAEFLTGHAVRLTLNQIARRLGISATRCRAGLNVLLDAHVVVEAGGVYERFFPQSAALRPSRASAA